MSLEPSGISLMVSDLGQINNKREDSSSAQLLSTDF